MPRANDGERYIVYIVPVQWSVKISLARRTAVTAQGPYDALFTTKGLNISEL
jgi:hypothetical protein